MAKQLIFSSVPYGLQPGRSGYCLVAGHMDLPQSLIRQLEQETSVFPVGEELVAPRHEVKQIGGTNWHLFINQATNLKDYSGRRSGVTHVIAECADRIPDGISPQEILIKLDGWITEIPKIPTAYDESFELSLPGTVRKTPSPLVKTRSTDRTETDPESWIYSKSNRKRPVPRPRSGIYYDGRRRKKSHLTWILGALILLIVILVIVL